MRNFLKILERWLAPRQVEYAPKYAKWFKKIQSNDK